MWRGRGGVGKSCGRRWSFSFVLVPVKFVSNARTRGGTVRKVHQDPVLSPQMEQSWIFRVRNFGLMRVNVLYCSECCIYGLVNFSNFLTVIKRNIVLPVLPFISLHAHPANKIQSARPLSACISSFSTNTKYTKCDLSLSLFARCMGVRRIFSRGGQNLLKILRLIWVHFSILKFIFSLYEHVMNLVL